MTHKPQQDLGTSRSTGRRAMAARVVAGVAVAAAALALAPSAARAESVPYGPGALAAPSAFPVPLGLISKYDNGTATVTVDVPFAGEYRVSYLVFPPDIEGQIRTVVDGNTLADAISPARPGTYGAYTQTQCFQLTAGQHTFTMTSVRVPSTIGASANLVPVVPSSFFAVPAPILAPLVQMKAIPSTVLTTP
jgi:hypothetical protein